MTVYQEFKCEDCEELYWELQELKEKFNIIQNKVTQNTKDMHIRNRFK